MQIAHNNSELAEILSQIRQKNASIGFVPTMGALHSGHLSLVEKALAENDAAVCSIYVNPTQFNNSNDLDNYPRTKEQDLQLLEKAGCNLVFMPSLEDLYPNGPELENFDFGGLDRVMEGEHRPGHFQGMATVVKRFLMLIEPNNAYFGEKDFQQLLVVKQLAKQLGSTINIVGCPVAREADGLAMSSRNLRLNPQQRHAAAVIFEALIYIKEAPKNKPLSKAIARAIELINAHPHLAVEYVEVADGETLKPLKNWHDAQNARAFTAVFAGDVRLIDNISLS